MLPLHHRRDLGDNSGGGTKPAVDISSFNLRRSEVRNMGKIRLDEFLTLRRLMSYIYIYIYIYIYMEHTFLMFLDHTQRRSTVGRTPLDE